MKNLSKKGFGYLLPLAIGLITLVVGVTMLFIMPEFIISTMNSTGMMDIGECYAYNTSAGECGDLATNCCEYMTYHNATTKVDIIRNIGMAVIIISLVWIIIAVISGRKQGGM